MRMFLAMELPRPVKEYLESAVKRISPGARGVKWVRPEGMHVTLKFFGEIDETRVREIESVLDGIGMVHGPVQASLKAIDAFPGLARPRVIVVTFEEGVDNMKAIFHDIEGRLSTIGVEKEERAFVPHVTLGRVKDPSSLRERAWPVLEKRRFAVDRLVLFRSTLTREGAFYTPLKEVKFGGDVS